MRPRQVAAASLLALCIRWDVSYGTSANFDCLRWLCVTIRTISKQSY